VRAPVRPSIASAACVPFSDIPGLGSVVKDSVSWVEAGAVRTAGGSLLPFDYLVLAPGCSYRDPTFVAPACGEGTVAERVAATAARAAAVTAAPAVVVVGGGPVGVEAAAEVAVAHPDKEVVLVTASETLLAGKPAALSRAARGFLEAKGVRIVTDQKVVAGKGGRLVCEPSGEALPAGAAPLWCVPGPPNTAFLDGPAVAAAAAGGGGQAGSSLLPPPTTLLDGAGAIVVDAHLRVKGSPTWFALGDAAAIPGVKLGYLARGQAAVVVANIKALEAGGGPRAARPDTPLPSAWKPNGGIEMMFVTLGPAAGTAHVGSWITLPSALVAAIKSRDLFVGKARRGVGAPPAPAGSI
jgi:apoptosis-inducing factor 2